MEKIKNIVINNMNEPKAGVLSEYEERMIMTGTSVENVENLGGEIDRVVVGRVLTCEDVEELPKERKWN